jgi:hypothetical protein
MNNALNSLTGFSKGNIETAFYYVRDYLPKSFTYVEKTVLPILDATLIQLFGGYNNFSKVDGEIKFTDQKVSSFASQALFTFVYNVPIIANVQVDDQAVLKDKNYIQSKLNPLIGQYLQRAGVEFDLTKGNIIVTLIMKIGAVA